MPEENNLYKNLIESCDGVIYLKDGEGRFLLANQALADFFEAPVEEIIGRTDYDFASKEQADVWREQDKKIITTGKTINFRFTDTSGEDRRTFIDHKFPVKIPDYPDAVGGIAVDVTEFE